MRKYCLVNILLKYLFETEDRSEVKQFDRGISYTITG